MTVKRADELSKRIVKRLFTGRSKLAMALRIYPEPYSEIHAVIASILLSRKESR